MRYIKSYSNSDQAKVSDKNALYSGFASWIML